MARARTGRQRRVRERAAVVQVETATGRVLPGGPEEGRFEAQVRALLTELRGAWATLPPGELVIDVVAREPADVPRAAAEAIDQQFTANVARLLATAGEPVEMARLDATAASPAACRVTARFVPAPLDTPAGPVHGGPGARRPDGVAGEPEQQSSWQEREEQRRGGGHGLVPGPPPGAEYTAVLDRVATDYRQFLARVRDELTPALRAEAADRWRRQPGHTVAERQVLVDWVNGQLDALGLSFHDPSTGLSARFFVTARGEFRIVPVGSRTAVVDRSDLLAVLPHFHFGPARRQGTAVPTRPARPGSEGRSPA